MAVRTIDNKRQPVVLVALLVSLTGLFCEALDNGCSDGWFGPSCSLRCHCQNRGCHQGDGSCMEGVKCRRGWFGLGCQYADQTPPTAPAWLRDHDNTTCNPDPTADQLVLQMRDIPIFFSWMILIFNVDKTNLSLTVTFDINRPCKNMVIFAEDPKSFEIYCTILPTRVQHNITIKGPDLGHVCTLYINGDRNVALKHKTSLKFGITGSDLAVDGDRTSDKCVESKNFKPSWYLDLSGDYRLSHAIIYESLQKGTLPGFTLALYDAINRPLFSLTDEGDQVGPMFTIELPHNISVSKIRLTGRSSELNLCEFELYGELACSKSGCSGTCVCNEGLCNSVTGGCPRGCPDGKRFLSCTQDCAPGMYGRNCSGSCAEHCQSGMCNSVSTQSCGPGTYGPACSQTCPQACASHCHQVTGSCLTACPAGFDSSANCTEGCQKGTFGVNCSQRCVPECKDGSCDRVTGECVFESERQDKGQECPKGMFGHECSRKCQQVCEDGLCDNETGTCQTKEVETLSEGNEKGNLDYRFVALAIAALIGIAFLATFIAHLFSKRDTDSEAGEEDTRKHAKSRSPCGPSDVSLASQG